MGTLLLSVLAGMLTTLSPCVLPILPFVIIAALNQHRYGPLALAAGLSLTFAGLGLLVFGAGWAFDLSGDTVRTVAAVLMLVFGALLLSTLLVRGTPQGGLTRLLAPLTAALNTVLERMTARGLLGQFALGALLGAVWSPCSGPTLGAAVTLAGSSATAASAAATMLFFGLGASLPLLALAYGSRQALKTRRDLFAKIERATRPVLGAVLIATGLLILFGLDHALEAAFLEHMPDWLVTLTTRF